MTFTITAVDETWGNSRIVSQHAHKPNYADAKAMVVQTVDVAVKDILKRTDQLRVSTIADVPGARYGVVIEWCVDGKLIPPDGYEWSASTREYGLQQAVVIRVLRDDL